MEKEKKMTTCAHCGAEIAEGATCPRCGGKNKKPIYKRGWFIAVLVVLALGIFSSLGGGSGESASAPEEPEQAEEIVYTAYDLKELDEDLDENPLKAADKYDEQYVELTGKLNVIDSDGDYISIVDSSNPYAILGVHCSLKNQAQRDAVMDFSIGDLLVVRGKITEVGEIMGYSMNVTELSKAN